MAQDQETEFRINRTYVLRLHSDNDPQGGGWRGQIEHVVTGRRRDFGSVEEMLVALARDLGEAPPVLRRAPPEP